MTTAWIAGGSGLVGGEVLRLLLQDDFFSEVVAVGRRTLPIVNPKLVQAKVDFADPSSFEPLDPTEIAFAAIGTTRKKAGSAEAFRAVDYGAVLTYAKAALHKGARTFLHVSALGANPRSPFLYYKVKGEVEEAIARLGFESVYAFRPSFLDGERPEQRPLEHLVIAIGRTLGPLLGRWRPTPVDALARMMVAKAKNPVPGVHVIEADEIIGMVRPVPPARRRPITTSS
jgi:uncharacterized protein YbjT (DUF2867 family)